VTFAFVKAEELRIFAFLAHSGEIILGAFWRDALRNIYRTTQDF
jgi:hypothetical protein